MTQKIFIAFYDDEDGGDRENWNTFYTPWVAGKTKEEARARAEAAIQQTVVDGMKEYGVDMEDFDEAALSVEEAEELEYLRNCASDMIIEIQEGEL